MTTRRLNQDGLELFFGCTRQISGPHDHPDAVNFMYRFKKFLLGKEVTLVSYKSNVNIADDNDVCFSADEAVRKTEAEYDRELSLEICLTSLFFRNVDLSFTY